MKLAMVNSLGLFLLLTTCINIQDQGDAMITYDILIQGGTIIDGSGSPGIAADLLIQDSKIVQMGNLDIHTLKVKTVIDATGKVVTPGFIDSHAHGNPTKTPMFRNFSGMGVTTIVLGQDGESADDIAAWMTRVEEAHPAINIATLVGHGTVRNLSGVKLNPDPSPEDLQRMAALVAEAMELGCFGLSTGLEYQPGSFSKLSELEAIATPVGQQGGLVHSHTRNEDNDAIEQSIAELIAQGKAGGCPVNISHLKVVYGHGAARAEDILLQMETARNGGVFVTADIYPYLASFTGIGIIFPDWAKPPYNYAEVVQSSRTELATYLRERVNLRNGPEATLIGTEPWAGKNLAELAVELDKPFEDVLIDDIGPKGASAAYFVMDQALQDRLFIDPYVMVCSDGSPTMRHPRGFGSFAKVIRYYVRENNLLSLEEAIYKMTGLPASSLGLVQQKRGLLQEGFAADILIFDPEAVVDKATFENPHQIAEGFDWVIVNGIPIRANGDFTEARGGKVLKKI